MTPTHTLPKELKEKVEKLAEQNAGVENLGLNARGEIIYSATDINALTNCRSKIRHQIEGATILYNILLAMGDEMELPKMDAGDGLQFNYGYAKGWTDQRNILTAKYEAKLAEKDQQEEIDWKRAEKAESEVRALREEIAKPKGSV